MQAHEVITDELQSKGSDSRLLAARIGHAALSEVSGYKRQKLLAALPAANEAGSLLQKANVPCWERQQDRAAGVVVNLAILDRPTEAVSTVESQ